MYTGRSETDAIMADPDALKAIGQAENEIILADFKIGIVDLAQEAVDGKVTDAEMFERVGDMMEAALKARANIRLKYKTSLL